jgi:hypothetical protein
MLYRPVRGQPATLIQGRMPLRHVRPLQPPAGSNFFRKPWRQLLGEKGLNLRAKILLLDSKTQIHRLVLGLSAIFAEQQTA